MSLGFRVESTNKRFDASGWVQVYEFGPQDDETRQQKGNLVCAISITVKDKDSLVEPSSCARKALNQLHQNYYGVSDRSAYDSLVSSLNTLSKSIQNDSFEVRLSCLVIVGEAIYVGVIGSARVSLLRNKSLHHILTTSQTPIVASGRMIRGDLIILSIGGESVIDSLETQAILTKRLNLEVSQEMGSLLDSSGESYALGLVKFDDGTNQELDSIYTKAETTPLAQSKGKNNPIRIIQRKLVERNLKIRLDDEEIPRQRKSASIVGVLIIGLLIVSIIFGMIQKNNLDQVAKYSDRLSRAEKDYQTAIDLYAISPNESRSTFAESKRLVSELTTEGVEDERLTNLINLIAQNEGKITGEYRSEPQLFVDLSLFSDDFGGKEMSTGETTLYVLSSAGDRVVSVDFPSKRSEIVVGPKDLKDGIALANFNYDIFYLSGDGVFDASNDEKIADKYWDGDVLLYSYGGNIYLLDKSKSVIYRHSATQGGYTDQSEWTKEDQERDLSQINSWSIDGLMWLLSSSGKIAKYSQGVEQNFNINGLPSELNSPVDIYTNENIDNLYVLDPTNSRVVVITKDGDYVASYTSQMLSSAKKVSVSEQDKLMFVLLEGKIYSLELRHLENL